MFAAWIPAVLHASPVDNTTRIPQTGLPTITVQGINDDRWRRFKALWNTDSKPQLGILYRGMPGKLMFHGSRPSRNNATKMSFRLRWTDPSGRVHRRIFKSGYFDPTRLREWLGLKMFAAADIISPRGTLVRLVINRETPGVYLMVEAVDTEYLVRLSGKQATAKSLLYYGDPPSSRLLYQTDLSPLPPRVPLTEVYTGILTEPDPQSFALKKLVYLLNQPRLELTSLQETADLRQWARWFAVSELIENWDSPWEHRGNNYSLYRPADGRWQLLPWDPDHIFEDRGYYFPESRVKGLQALLASPVFSRQVKADILQLAKTRLSLKKIFQWIDTATMQLEPVIRAGQEPETGLLQWKQAVSHLKHIIRQRYSRLNTLICREKNKGVPVWQEPVLHLIGDRPECEAGT